MFLVIEFTDDNSVEVVPGAWVKDDKICRWPPYRNQHVVKAIRDQESPLEGWSEYAVRKIGGPYADYAKARAKCRRAEETSDMQSTDTESRDCHKRRKKVPKQYSSPLESGSDSDSADATQTRHTTTNRMEFARATPLPPPPSVPSLPSTTMPTFAHSQLHLPPPPPAPPQPSTSTVSSGDTAEQYSFLQKLVVNLSQRVEELNQCQKTMNDRLLLMDASLKLALTDQASTPPMPAEELPFPVCTMEEMDDLEGKLEESSYSKKVAASLATIGGKNSKTITRRIMERVLSHQLALQFNWLGRGEKRAFSRTELYSTVMSAARANKHVEVKEEEVESAAKDWLHFAKDRQGGRKERDATKQSQT